MKRQQMEATILSWVIQGLLGKKRDYIGFIYGLYQGYIGRMENNMETTITLNPLNPTP